ncbi:MAG: methyl-accepting chemotaxis protein, partial [Spirochaetota bacterium]
MLVFFLPGSYPQFYVMIYGFEFYIVIVSRIILNQLVQTYIETDTKNIQITKSNEKLKGYLFGISESINLLKENSLTFEKTSKELNQKSINTKEKIDLLKEKIINLTRLNNEIHDIDLQIIDLSKNQINTGNDLRSLIEKNSNNFSFMKDNLSITKEFSNQIEDISKQTVLLGLNASIEATKSSEYSKSFSVVAAEVKNLASKSNDLVNKIKVLADDIIISTESGIESSKLLSEYFEEFYRNFQQFMNILDENQKIHKGIEVNFNIISDLISKLSEIINNLSNYANDLRNENF